jgi:hypothetical protein
MPLLSYLNRTKVQEDTLSGVWLLFYDMRSHARNGGWSQPLFTPQLEGYVIII